MLAVARDEAKAGDILWYENAEEWNSKALGLFLMGMMSSNLRVSVTHLHAEVLRDHFLSRIDGETGLKKPKRRNVYAKAEKRQRKHNDKGMGGERDQGSTTNEEKSKDH